MRKTKAIIIGAGQAGLATSRCLTEHGLEHVIMERGRAGQRWRSERWDSLRLLTPNWQSRLPSWKYRGMDPNGYMSMPEVTRVDHDGEQYRVHTDRGTWCAPNVIIATGHCDVPYVPPMSAGLSRRLMQTVPTRYRRPSDLPDGGVLVVGASASGVQLADELRRVGRHVTISVGRHTRLPRMHRGRDIMVWLDAMGTLGQTTVDVENPLSQPSLQLVGRPDHGTLDLAALAARGVRVVGHATGCDGHRVRFASDLAQTTSAADSKLSRLTKRLLHRPIRPRRRTVPAALLPSALVDQRRDRARPRSRGHSHGPLGDGLSPEL